MYKFIFCVALISVFLIGCAIEDEARIEVLDNSVEHNVEGSINEDGIRFESDGTVVLGDSEVTVDVAFEFPSGRNHITIEDIFFNTVTGELAVITKVTEAEMGHMAFHVSTDSITLKLPSTNVLKKTYIQGAEKFRQIASNLKRGFVNFVTRGEIDFNFNSEDVVHVYASSEVCGDK